jgi:hypothetical protein
MMIAVGSSVTSAAGSAHPAILLLRRPADSRPAACRIIRGGDADGAISERSPFANNQTPTPSRRETSAWLGSARTPQAGTARDFGVIGAIIAVKASHRQAVAVLGIAVASRFSHTWTDHL